MGLTKCVVAPKSKRTLLEHLMVKPEHTPFCEKALSLFWNDSTPNLKTVSHYFENILKVHEKKTQKQESETTQKRYYVDIIAEADVQSLVKLSSFSHWQSFRGIFPRASTRPLQRQGNGK